MTEDRIAVKGSATRTVAADRVRWTLAVAESGDAPAEAFARCGERLDELTGALRAVLDDDAEVRTGAVRVVPQRDDHGRSLRSVDATGEVLLTVALTAAGEAAGAAMSAGADRLRGPDLLVDDAAAVTAELYGEAVADARRKAASAAAAAGRTLGRVVSAEEGDGHPIPVARAAMMSAGGGPDLEPADEQIGVALRVTFALED